MPDLERGARPRPRADAAGRRARRPPHLHGDARAARIVAAPRACRASTGSAPREDPRRPPLPGLPEHLCRPRQHRRARRAARPGAAIELEVTALGMGQRRVPASTTSSTSAAGRTASRRCRARSGREGAGAAEAVAGGAAVLAVCGGYQLLGRFYRDRYGAELPGVGAAPAPHGRRRAPDDRRRAARVRARAGRAADARRLREPRRPDASSTTARSRSAAFSPASATTARAATRAAAPAASIGTYLHGPLLPRNPWLADWLLAQALAHATGGEPPELAAARRRARGASSFRLRGARPRTRRRTLTHRSGERPNRRHGSTVGASAKPA